MRSGMFLNIFFLGLKCKSKEMVDSSEPEQGTMPLDFRPSKVVDKTIRDTSTALFDDELCTKPPHALFTHDPN